MPTICIRLEPSRLANPDTDLRQALPDFIVERAAGLVTTEHVWAYTPGGAMVVFLGTVDLERGLREVLRLVRNDSLMGNVLRDGCSVATAPSDAIDEGDEVDVVYTPNDVPIDEFWS